MRLPEHVGPARTWVALWTSRRATKRPNISVPSAAVAGAPAIPSAFALGVIEPIPNKIGEVSFQRRL
jgi:hypothetical protein